MLVLTGAILSNFVKIITTKTSFLRPAQLTLLSCGRKRRGEGEKGRGGSSNPPAFSPPPPPPHLHSMSAMQATASSIRGISGEGEVRPQTPIICFYIFSCMFY